MKLKIGDQIKVIGFPMLEKLRDGKVFEVYNITQKVGFGSMQNVYWLKSGRTRIGHYADNVDRSIHGGSDLNRLEIVK